MQYSNKKGEGIVTGNNKIKTLLFKNFYLSYFYIDLTVNERNKRKRKEFRGRVKKEWEIERNRIIPV